MLKTFLFCALTLASVCATAQSAAGRSQLYVLDLPHPGDSTLGDTLFLTMLPAENQFCLIWRGDTLVQEFTWSNPTNIVSSLGPLGVTNAFFMQLYSGDGCPATYQLLTFREDGTPFTSGPFGNCNELASLEVEWPVVRFSFNGMREAHRKKTAFTYNASTFTFSEDNVSPPAYTIELRNGKFMGIDAKKKVLYEVFLYDNGPDYEADGLFRIVENGLIGYADAVTGKVVIAPRYPCAWPFENGVAKVSTQCTTRKDGEYTMWESSAWEYIDKTGKSIKKQE